MNQPYQQQGGVPPVPPNLMLPNLPHRPPFVPQLQVKPMMQQYLQTITGHLMYEIQRLANNNALRQALFWKMSPNMFNNQLFVQMVASAVDYVDFLMTTQRLQPNQAVQHVSAHMTSIYAALEAANHPGLMATMDQSGQMDVQRLLNDYRQLDAAISQFMTMQMQPQPQPMMMGGGGGGYPPGYGQPPGGASYGYPTVGYGAPAAPVYHNPINLQNNYGGGGGGIPTPTYRGQGAHAPQNSYQPPNGGAWGTPVGRMDTGGVRGPSLKPVDRTQQPAAIEHRPEPAPVQQQQPVQQPPQAKAVESAVEEILMDNTKQSKVLLASNSGLTITYNSNAPWPVLYNPETTVLCHVIQGDGKVIEQCVKKEDNMKLEDHETIHFFKPRTKLDANHAKDYEAARAAFSEVVAQRDVTEIIKDHKKSQGTVEILGGGALYAEPLFVNNDTLVGNHDHNYALDFAEYIVGDENYAQMDLTVVPVSFNHLAFYRWRLVGEGAVTAMEIAGSRDYVTLKERLLKLREILALPFWNEVHDDVTRHVNEIVTIQMGIPASDPLSINIIDSFIDDIEDLIEHIRTEYGERLAEVFMDTAGTVATASAKAYDGATFQSYHNDREPDDQLACGFAQFSDVTLLPISSQDLVMNYVGKCGMVLESEYPEVYQAIKKRFDSRKIVMRNTIFVTNDGEEIYAYKGLNARDCYLLRKGR